MTNQEDDTIPSKKEKKRKKEKKGGDTKFQYCHHIYNQLIGVWVYE